MMKIEKVLGDFRITIECDRPFRLWQYRTVDGSINIGMEAAPKRDMNAEILQKFSISQKELMRMFLPEV